MPRLSHRLLTLAGVLLQIEEFAVVAPVVDGELVALVHVGLDVDVVGWWRFSTITWSRAASASPNQTGALSRPVIVRGTSIPATLRKVGA